MNRFPYRFGPNRQRTGWCVRCFPSTDLLGRLLEFRQEPMPTDLDATSFAGEGLRHIPAHIADYLGMPTHRCPDCVNAFATASKAAHRWYYFRFDGDAVASTTGQPDDGPEELITM